MTPQIVICQASLFRGFSRQEYWSGLPFPSPGGLPDLGMKNGFPVLQADSLPPELQGSPTIFYPVAKANLRYISHHNFFFFLLIKCFTYFPLNLESNHITYSGLKIPA